MTGKELLPAPANFQEAMDIAEIMSRSQLIPKNFQGRPNDVVVAMMWSHTLGIPTVQGLQYIAVINGKPSMYGDGLLAVAMASGQMADFKETFVGGDSDDGLTAICTVKRKGLESPIIGQFSVADAKRAGLWGKIGPWKQYPKRMLKMRARAFALRDAFPDILSGMGSGEEQEDIINGTHTEVSDQPPAEEKPARKMPRRKKAATADAAVVEDAVVSQPEDQPQQTEPAAEEVPQEQTPSEAAAPTEEQAEEPKTPSKDVEEVFQKLHQARTRQDLMQIWRSLPFDIQSDQEMVSAFQKRQADISLAESEGAAQ